MKTLFTMSVLIFSSLVSSMVSSPAQAGSPPSTSCSNEGGTIQVRQNAVSVLVSMYPSEQRETFSLNDLIVAEQTVQQMPSEKVGCTSRSVVFKQIVLSKKDGSPMPNAYNRLAQDGALTDYFICSTRQAWMAAPGQSCN